MAGRRLKVALWVAVAAVAMAAAMAATLTPVVDFRRQLVAAINAKRADKGLAELCINRSVLLAALLGTDPIGTDRR
jgi:hypothetical protein